MQTIHLVRALQFAGLNNSNFIQAHAAAAAKYGETSPAARLVKSLASMSEDIQDTDLCQTLGDMLELARPTSLPSKIKAISGFKPVPFHTRVLVQSDGSPAHFVEETGVIPLGSLNFQGATLQRRRVAGIVPFTREVFALLDGSATSVEVDLVRAIAEIESTAFFNDSPGTEHAPAGILYGTAPGTGSNNVSADVSSLIARFSGNLDGAILLTSPKNGVTLSSVFEGSGARGGDAAGIAHVTHSAIPNDRIALIEPGRILFSDGGLAIEVARQTSLYEVDSSGAVSGAVSLWQTNCIALGIIRWLNWQPAVGAVAWLDGVNW